MRWKQRVTQQTRCNCRFVRDPKSCPRNRAAFFVHFVAGESRFIARGFRRQSKCLCGRPQVCVCRGSPSMTIRSALFGLCFAAVAQPAYAQIFWQAPDFRDTAVTPGENLGVILPGATPEEERAGWAWQLRSGLNVMALQCQFDRTLLTENSSPISKSLVSMFSPPLKSVKIRLLSPSIFRANSKDRKSVV